MKTPVCYEDYKFATDVAREIRDHYRRSDLPFTYLGRA